MGDVHARPGHVHVGHPSSTPRCTLSSHRGRKTRANTPGQAQAQAPSIPLLPVEQAPSCPSVEHLAGAHATMLSRSLSPAAGDARVHPRRGTFPRPRTSPPRSPNKRPPHALLPRHGPGAPCTGVAPLKCPNHLLSFPFASRHTPLHNTISPAERSSTPLCSPRSSSPSARPR
jgi:hypothetical protein